MSTINREQRLRRAEIAAHRRISKNLRQFEACLCKSYALCPECKDLHLAYLRDARGVAALWYARQEMHKGRP